MYVISYKEAIVSILLVWIGTFGACYLLEKRLENADYPAKINTHP